MKTRNVIAIGLSVIIIASLSFFYAVNLLMFSDLASEPGVFRDGVFIGAIGSLVFIFVGVISILFNYKWSKVSP